jgi:hypothetical protein
MESCLHLRINAGEGKRLGGIINTSWIPQPIFVAKKGQTFSKIRQGKSDRSVSLNQMESGVVFSTNSTDACGAKSGGADRGGRTRPTRKEPIMNLLTTWNPLPEREDSQNRLSSLFGGAGHVSPECLGRITAKESRILFLPTHPHCYRPAKQFAKKHKKSIHIIVAAFVIATAITQCGEQYKTTESTRVELWF